MEKIKKKMPLVLFGSEFWGEVLNFEPLIRYGTISPEDLDLFLVTDSIDEAYDFLVRELTENALPHPGGSL